MFSRQVSAAGFANDQARRKEIVVGGMGGAGNPAEHHLKRHDGDFPAPVNDDLARGLAAVPSNSDKVCFPEQNAINRSTKRSKRSAQFGRILQALGIQGHSFHDLRQTFCSECQRKGIPTPHIAKLVGHSNEATIKTYLHNDDKYLTLNKCKLFRASSCISCKVDKIQYRLCLPGYIAFSQVIATSFK